MFVLDKCRILGYVSVFASAVSRTLIVINFDKFVSAVMYDVIRILLSKMIQFLVVKIHL